MENLRSIDKKRNRRRESYKLFIDYINKHREELPSFEFNKNKDIYLPMIDSYFPEANLISQLEELRKKDAINKACAEKFNGDIIMEYFPELKGEELGKAIGLFKQHFKESNQDYKDFVLNNDKETIILLFLKVISKEIKY
jgi:hypothetical protein